MTSFGLKVFTLKFARTNMKSYQKESLGKSHVFLHTFVEEQPPALYLSLHWQVPQWLALQVQHLLAL